MNESTIIENKKEASDTKLTRRNFLHAGIGTAVAIPLGVTGVSTQAATVDKTKSMIINGLGGIGNPNPDARVRAQSRMKAGEIYSLDSRGLQDALDSGMMAVNLTMGYDASVDDFFESSVQSIGRWNAIISRHQNKLLKVRQAKDILLAAEENKVGIIYGFQNAAMVGDKAERVDIFANLGVKIIQLTYNVRNQIGDGCMVSENRGLTKFGGEVIERLHYNNVLVDLSHSGQQTCLDAIKAAKRPIAITHTGCQALADLPRNKTDEELRLVAEMGGVVGIYFMPFLKKDAQPMASDVVAHIEHAINICGEEHVSIGTDGGVTAVDDLALYRKNHHKQYERRIKLGIAATGERPDSLTFIEDLRGPTQFRKLAELLSARGHSSARIEKVLGRNLLRLVSDIWEV